MTEREFAISDPAHLEALSSPVRQQIVDAVCGTGACSIADIARILGRPADGLYYHVRALVRVGLLLPAGERVASGREEALYTVPARRILRLVYEPDDPENVQAVVRIARVMLRTAQRDFVSGFDLEPRVEGPERNLNASRQTAWLGSAQRRELNELLGRVQELFAEAQRDRHADEEDTELTSVTFVVAPLEELPVRRGAADD